MIYGARVSLEVGVHRRPASRRARSAPSSGLLAGFFRGWVDTLLSRMMDVVLAFPMLLLAIGLASACRWARAASAG